LEITMPTNFLKTAIKKLKHSASQFKRDVSGNMQIMLALTAAPLFGAAGLAIDYNRTLDAMVQIQDLADRTALFGASLVGTAEAQTTAANLFLDENELPLSGVTYDAEITHGVDSVGVKVTTDVEGSLFKVFFQERGQDGSKASMTPTIYARAKYARSSDQTFCLLTLDKTSAKAIHFQGTGSFLAQNCGVQSNSSHATQSTYMNGGATATADFFNAVGGWSQAGNSGQFSSTPEGGKESFDDPFKSTVSVTCPAKPSTSAASTNPSAANGTTIAAPTLFGGTTYNNVSIGSNRVGKLTQSVVYVFGTIDIKGTLTAPSTTIVLCGPNAVITMGAQAELMLAAPKSGTYAGFAVIASTTTVLTSTLRGGATTYIRGIWYTPEAGVDFGGNSQFNATTSNFFPLVAKTFVVSGTGGVKIGVDYAKPNPNSNAASDAYAKPTQLYKAGSTSIYLTKYEEN
jgi:Flp pilus assembly protein TadG